MFKRIKILALLQLSDRFKFKKVDNVKKLIAKIGIMALGMTLVCGVCVGIFFVLKFIAIDTPKVITFALVFLQLLSIIACVLGLLKTLYTSKDNAILLSYPAHHVEVFISKLVVYYLYEFLKSLFFTTPLLIAFAIMYKYFSVGFIVSSLVVIFTLPLIPVLLGALITLPILCFKKFLNRVPFVKTILLFAVLIGAFIGFYYLLSIIPRPLRIIQNYNEFDTKVTAIIDGFHDKSLFYQFVGNFVLGINSGLNMILYFSVLVSLVLLVALISMPVYFKLASSSSEQATEKKRKGVNKAHKNTFITFVRKEWLLSIRNFGEFISNYIFMFATPYVLFVMMSIYTAISVNSRGSLLTIVFSGFVTLMMSSASNTSSALAITKEGSEFVLLKSAPSNSANMAWAKIFFNLLFSSIMIVLSFLLVIKITPMFDGPKFNDVPEGIRWESLWNIMYAVLAINAGLIFWSFQIDIMNPKLREYATSGDTSGMNNANKSIMIGLIMALIFALFSFVILYAVGDTTVSWAIIIGFAIVFLLARFWLFLSYLKYVFPHIEF